MNNLENWTKLELISRHFDISLDRLYSTWEENENYTFVRQVNSFDELRMLISELCLQKDRKQTKLNISPKDITFSNLIEILFYNREINSIEELKIISTNCFPNRFEFVVKRCLSFKEELHFKIPTILLTGQSDYFEIGRINSLSDVIVIEVDENNLAITNVKLLKSTLNRN